MKKQIFALILFSLIGCTTPSQRFDSFAQDLGFDSELISTEKFQHKIYSNYQFATSKQLHVYLDGDGTPWVKKRWIAEDPTARNPLILGLMIQDKKPSILLGRPCYYGLNKNLACNQKYWTSHRYSKEIILSMANALNKWLKKHIFTEVVLIGYSGGGSIAVLMANSINKITKVVTLAANLNIKAWSQFHGYSTLKDSLNPIDEVKLNTDIKQLHLAGEEDDIVPAFIIKDYAMSQKNSKYYPFPGQTHACCWAMEWPKILDMID